MKYENIILDYLIKNGIDYIVHIPDKILLPLIEAAERRKSTKLILVTREEEGIGVCAGLHMAGHKPVMVMQSSGIGNSITAITGVLQTHHIPLLIIISIRGSLYEYNPSDAPLGSSIWKIMEALSIPFFVPRNGDEIRDIIDGIVPLCNSSQGPAVVGLLDQILRRREHEN